MLRTERSVQEWIRSTAPQIVPRSFDTVHLDELGYGKDEYWSQPFLEQIFVEAVDVVDSLKTWFKLSLVLPLEDLENFDRLPNPKGLTLDQLLRERREREPPSVYLTGHELSLTERSLEQYQYPLTWPMDQLEPEGYVVHLRIGRSLEAIRADWEYGRDISLEYAPPWKQCMKP